MCLSFDLEAIYTSVYCSKLATNYYLVRGPKKCDGRNLANGIFAKYTNMTNPVDAKKIDLPVAISPTVEDIDITYQPYTYLVK